MAKKFFTVVTDLGFNFSCVNEKTEDRHLVLASSKLKLLNKFLFTARKNESAHSPTHNQNSKEKKNYEK